jgi:hypothetical protein
MPSFTVVVRFGMDYPGGMATVGDIPRPRKRASQDETTPFLLEFEVVQSQGRRIQDETAPFPLMLEALRRRRKRTGQNEASPLLLALAGEPAAILGETGETKGEAVPRARRARHEPSGVPSLKWRGIDASRELREYAARIASGEDLPPYSGPILASDASADAPALAAPQLAESERPRASERAPSSVRSALSHTETTSDLRVSSPTSPAKVVLGLMLLVGALVASATAGDDAALRAAGQSIGAWFSGGAPSYEAPAPPASAPSRTVPAPSPTVPSSAPAQTPCVATAPALAR